MNKFKPADNYDSLLRQANTMYRLIQSLESQVSYLRKTHYDHSAERVSNLEAQLESERQMNHELTIELEKYEKTCNT